MSLVILTKSPECNLKICLNTSKSFFKSVIGRKRGPEVVNDSLLKGLDELGIKYKYNVNAKEIRRDDVMFVNSSLDALDWAIEAKKKGGIKKLIVGPNMVMLPSQQNSIMMSKEIDMILFPSEWTKDYWVSLEESLESKIKIWPAGIDVPVLKKENKDLILIYYKKTFEELLNFIETYFNKKNINYKVIRYGSYNKKTFFSLLDKTKVAIFLSESESQGLALFESWAHNVPTLVWNREYWQFGNHTWRDEKISAPYLTDECGIFFKDQNDFEEKFRFFTKKIDLFRPREYIIDNFIHKKIAENFISLINE